METVLTLQDVEYATMHGLTAADMFAFKEEMEREQELEECAIRERVEELKKYNSAEFSYCAW